MDLQWTFNGPVMDLQWTGMEEVWENTVHWPI